MRTELQERVRKGLVFLNGRTETDPELTDWPNRIDLETFDMFPPRQCVLGQLWGHYTTARERIGLTVEQARRYGFTLDTYDYRGHGMTPEEGYALLTAIWRERISVLKRA